MYLEYLEKVKNGELDPLKVYIELKQHQAEIDHVLKQIIDDALNEAEKYGQKSFKAFGAKIEIRNAASTYKFCEAINNYDAKLKQLKEMSKSGSFADETTGEIIEQAQKIEGKTTLAISFK